MGIGRTLGENLRKFIKKRGYRSVELFAYENAIDKSALSKVLRGERLPRIDTLVRMAEALEISLDDLYPMRRAQIETPTAKAKPKRARQD